MGQNYKDKNMLKFHPFYDDQIEIDEIDDTPSNEQLLEELPFLPEKPKKISNKELSQTLPFHPKKKLKAYAKTNNRKYPSIL